MPNTSKLLTKQDIKRAKSLLERIHRLQSDIYYFADHLQDKGVAVHETVQTSGFELDASHIEMKSALEQLEILYT